MKQTPRYVQNRCGSLWPLAVVRLSWPTRHGARRGSLAVVRSLWLLAAGRRPMIVHRGRGRGGGRGCPLWCPWPRPRDADGEVTAAAAMEVAVAADRSPWPLASRIAARSGRSL